LYIPVSCQVSGVFHVQAVDGVVAGLSSNGALNSARIESRLCTEPSCASTPAPERISRDFVGVSGVELLPQVSRIFFIAVAKSSVLVGSPLAAGFAGA